MTVLLVIAMAWLTLALACYLVLLFQSQRPVTETDRRCSRMDDRLRRQHGSRLHWER
ncbi:hypothetical protein DVA67_029885 [Solirubrobacter sp. CPCC 204708]|uniref:CcmD family protein n=1 Tax=Solirubrobacter deserti TaxID=2282478 RepID=A0ABT4RIN5_9ACTN|nr:hypothetical protein [Solirubrobacter deserti]MBE2320215.1 hypothetical protein [Solirubrobacter deserti]MDA0138399.1 hypothetical protein [Solirubrobacter deserti]